MTSRGCTGKQAYPSRAEAQAAANHLRKRVPTGSESLHAYHCPACGSFHFGRDVSQRGPQTRAKIDKAAKVRRYWQLVRGEA